MIEFQKDSGRSVSNNIYGFAIDSYLSICMKCFCYHLSAWYFSFFFTYHMNLATKFCSDMVLVDRCTSLVLMPYSVYSVCLLHCAGWTRDLRIKDPCGYIPWFYTRFRLSALLSNLFNPIYCNYVGFQGILVVFIDEDWLLFYFHLSFVHIAYQKIGQIRQCSSI